MKVFVAGATGVLGRRAVAKLVGAGHDVTAVTRSAQKADAMRGIGATPVDVDLFDPASVTPAVAGHEVVMNLATHIPSPSRAALRSAWRENDRLRRDASRILVEAALVGGATRYVQESIAFMYPDSGDAWIDEDVPLDPIPFARTVLDAEAQAKRFEAAGRTAVVLRLGQFYGDGVHTDLQVSMARRGISTFLGPREGYLASIQLDDAGDAVVAALRAPSGTYNVTDDEPLTRAEASAALAAAVGRPRLRTPPAAVARLTGGMGKMLLRSQRVSNRRFKEATGWAPAHPSARTGWSASVASS